MLYADFSNVHSPRSDPYLARFYGPWTQSWSFEKYGSSLRLTQTHNGSENLNVMRSKHVIMWMNAASFCEIVRASLFLYNG